MHGNKIPDITLTSDIIAGSLPKAGKILWMKLQFDYQAKI